MRISIAGTPEELGRRAAAEAAAYLNEAIRERGEARLLLSTGASQFTTLEALVRPFSWIRRRGWRRPSPG